MVYCVSCQVFLKCTIKLLRHYYFFFSLLPLVPEYQKIIFLRKRAFYSLRDTRANKQTFFFFIPECYPKGLS